MSSTVCSTFALVPNFQQIIPLTLIFSPDAIEFIAPGVLGDRNRFVNKFQAPILAGLEPESSAYQKRTMQEYIQILRNEMESMVLRRGPSFLAHLLKLNKAEYILHVKTSVLQQRLISLIANFEATHQTSDKKKMSDSFLSCNTAVRQIVGTPETFYLNCIAGYLEKDKQSEIKFVPPSSVFVLP